MIRVRAVLAWLRAAPAAVAGAVAQRADTIEACIGLALLAGGVALVLSVGAAMILVGAVLFTSAVWPQLRRR